MPIPAPKVRDLGRTFYEPVWQDMKTFTDQRDDSTPDELWLTEHEPVYTQGLNGRKEHILSAGGIPVVQIDRGGQVTYHGPGQLVMYCLLDLQRLGIGIRTLVSEIENSIIDLLARYDITAYADAKAPGVYIDGAKIAALGLRIRKGRCYHGLSFNLDMDLTPFSGINPCGFEGLAVTQLKDHVSDFSSQHIAQQLCDIFIQRMTYERTEQG
jgi:lipoyl(octanoyl) transferase